MIEMTPKIPAATLSRSWIATTPKGLSVSVNKTPRIGRVTKATRRIAFRPNGLDNLFGVRRRGGERGKEPASASN